MTPSPASIQKDRLTFPGRASRFCFYTAQNQRGFSSRNTGSGAVLIGIIPPEVAAEFLQAENPSIVCPTDERHALKGFGTAVHPVFKQPLHRRLIPFVEELPDLPFQDNPPAVPLLKPQPDLIGAMIFRPPALHIDCLRAEQCLQPGTVLPQPHGKPLPDPVFSLLHGTCLLSWLFLPLYHSPAPYRNKRKAYPAFRSAYIQGQRNS